MDTAAVSTVRKAEQELVERHRYGDPEAFDEVYAQFERMVYNLALRMSGDEEDAADLTQEIFLRIYRHLGGPMPDPGEVGPDVTIQEIAKEVYV